jgi:TRAP-type C4-dicarboxylate transport system permease small subunit
MARFLWVYGRLLRLIGRGERALGVFLLGLIVVCIFAQVVSRYLFGQPLVWVEELSTYAFIWGAFVGASLGLKQNRHIKILSFMARLTARQQRMFRGITDGAIAVFCALLAVNGVEAMTLFEWNQRTIALPIELPRFLFYSTPLIVATTSMALTALYNLFLTVLGHRTGLGATEGEAPL